MRGGDDTRSNYSGYTNYTDVSIDPAIRAKAEQILRTEVDAERLDTINEDDEVGGPTTLKLTKDVLSTLEGGRNDTKSLVPSQLRSKRASIDAPKPNELQSRFEDSSMIDQDDSYGNYRPAFLIKKHKVSGRTEEIMKL